MSKPLAAQSTTPKKLSSGLYMTVWQQTSNEPQTQAFIALYERIQQVEQKFHAQEMRLNELEEKIDKTIKQHKAIVHKVNLLIPKRKRK